MDNKQQAQPAGLILPALTKDLSPAQQGWLTLAELTVKTFKDLENKELVVQGCLLKFDQADLPTIQDKIKQAKVAAEEAKAQRLGFTNVIKDKLVTPMMVYEKRNDDLIAKAAEKELALRIEAEKKGNENAELLKEEEAFKAHFTNEYFAIAAEYRILLRQTITDYYVRALEKKVAVFKIDDFKKDVAASIATAQTRQPAKFDRKLITVPRAQELFNGINPYNKENDLKDAQGRILDEIFSTYANDFKRPKAAAKEIITETAEVVKQEEQKLVAEVETNNLLASATVVTDTPKVKRSYEPVIEDTPEWALNILSLTIKKWNSVKVNFKVKEIKKLTVEQMAKALAAIVNETGVQIDGFKTKEVKK